MNITIPYSWLTEFLTTDAPPAKIAECLSLCGPSVEKITKSGNDWIYEIEVTTNRVDCMSVLGIAREAAAILPRFGYKAKFHTSGTLPEVDQNQSSLPLKITDKNRLCRRIMAVVLDNVKLQASPKYVTDRLNAAGIRSLNNAVDITNYVMTEIGHPTHVFDYDRIKSKKLIIRNSKSGETIVSLEDKKYSLPGGDVVIDDGSGKIIDLPGIIGTANSIVTNTTKRVIFFLETNNPVKMRRTSMTLGIRTVAATLNEKGVDPETAAQALNRGIQLFKQLTGATVALKVYDLYPSPYRPKIVTAPLQLIKERLGIEISQKEVDQILKSLGFKNNLVPSWRAKDINIPEDIVEEVARIYGYHRLPAVIMSTAIPTNHPQTNFKLELKIKYWLAGWGLTEIYTNSLVGYEAPGQLKIKNALSTDWQYLRNSLIPSHIQKFPAFEIANTYHNRPGKLPEERLQLIISGIPEFPKLKGIIDALALKLHTEINADYNNNTAVIDLSPVLARARIYPCYRPLSAYSPIIEDLTFTLPERTYLGPVIQTIKSIDRFITAVHLYSMFENNFTFRITYQSQTKQLSAAMIAPIRKKIVTALKTKFKTDLVGELG